MEKPAIVVVAYNKKGPFLRLINSLKKAKYPPNAKLIISIDMGGNPEVIDIANDFSWEYGEKEIIIHKKHLGLRNHIIKCGDLTQEYGSVILLEDDLLVSPMFYLYTTKALNFYRNEENIAGISLYSQSNNIFTGFPFIPLEDKWDVYFLQIPASWGEAWNTDQWAAFKRWYEVNKGKIKQEEGVPTTVFKWPESSWAKYFWTFMVLNNKFFVYPKSSLTTQFGEIGIHSPRKSSVYQVPLQLTKSDFKFAKFDDSIAIYDSFYEILPDRLNKFTNQFKEYTNYTVDLNGTKELDKIKTNLVLTSKQCKDWIFSYGKELKPVEMNIFNNIMGAELFFCSKNSIKEGRFSKIIQRQKDYIFYYRDIPKRKLFALLFFKSLKII